MRLKGFLITLVSILTVIFAVTNWGALTTELPVSLIFFRVPLPLGLILLLIALGLSFLFFFVSLIDRAGQLRQITQLERHIETLQTKLDKRRQEEVASLEESMESKLDAVVTRLGESAERLESATRESLSEFETRSNERFEKLEERVLLVRNELAADIGAAQENIRKSQS